MIGPEERVEAVFVSLLEEPNVLARLSIQIWTHACHVQSKLTRLLKVLAQEIVEDCHVGLLLEEDMVG